MFKFEKLLCDCIKIIEIEKDIFKSITLLKAPEVDIITLMPNQVGQDLWRIFGSTKGKTFSFYNMTIEEAGTLMEFMEVSLKEEIDDLNI